MKQNNRTVAPLRMATSDRVLPLTGPSKFMPTTIPTDALVIDVSVKEYHEIKNLEQPAELADYERILGTGDMRATSIFAASFHDREVFVRPTRP